MIHDQMRGPDRALNSEEGEGVVVWKDQKGFWRSWSKDRKSKKLKEFAWEYSGKASLNKEYFMGVYRISNRGVILPLMR